MSYRSRGFTLIELMIVIALIAILASLAVSAYQTYTVRAQISEGLSFAVGAKVPVVDAYTNGGVAPANRVAAGMTPTATDTRGSYVTSVEIVNGRIDVMFGGPLAHQDIIGTAISLTVLTVSIETALSSKFNCCPIAGNSIKTTSPICSCA